MPILLTVLGINYQQPVFAQWGTFEGIRVDRNGIANGQHSSSFSLPGITFGNASSNSGEGIGSKRNAGTYQNGLDFFTNYMRRFNITNDGLVNIGAVNTAAPNTNANLEIQATGSNIAFRAYPFTGTFNRSVMISGPAGRPGITFDEVGNKYDIRAYNNGLEINKNGSGIGLGSRFIWDAVYGVGFELGNAYNTSLLNKYSMFVEKGIKSNLINTNNIGIGTTNPVSAIDIIDNSLANPAIKIVSGNKQSIVSLTDQTLPTYVPTVNTGMLIQRTLNNNVSAAYMVGTNNVLRLQTDQVDNTSNGTGLISQAGVFRTTGLSAGTFTAVDAWAKNGATCYGIKSEAGDPFQCSNLSYGGYFKSFGNTSYGIYAEGVGCSGSSNAWAAYLKGKTEINAIAPNTSGLKFTQLTLASPSLAPNGKSLSVDATGQVILVDNCCVNGGTNYTAGAGINIAAGVISNTSPSKWVASGNDIYNGNSGNVGIGTTAPTSRLHTVTNNQLTGFTSENNVSNSAAMAIYGKANTTAGQGTGGAFEGSNSGVYAAAETDLDQLQPSQAGSPIYDLKGVEAYANDYGTNNGQITYGVKSQAFTSSSNATAIGLYGFAMNSANSSNDYAVYADGDIITTGVPTGFSDARLKTDVNSISNALDIVNQLDAKTYHYRKDGRFATTSLPSVKSYGFIAQELEKVLPEAVKEAPLFFHDKDKRNNQSENYKSVNYIALIPILSQAIKEQQTEIKEQQQMIDELKNMVNSLTSQDVKKSIQDADLSRTQDGVTLSQNVPNPFSANTKISYSIPSSYQSAKLGVYDLNGHELKLIDLTSAKGDVIIEGGHLQAGMYLFSLIVDGKTLATKKMTLTSH